MSAASATELAAAKAELAAAEGKLAAAKAELAAAKAELAAAKNEEDKKRAEEYYDVIFGGFKACQALVNRLVNPTLPGPKPRGVAESACALLDSDGAVLAPDSPLVLHQVVSVSVDQRDDRDRQFAPSTYVVTRQCLDLIELFFANYHLSPLQEPQRWKELCIYGTPGCGKSCCAKILEGEIKRRLPAARLFSSREKLQSRLSAEQLSTLYKEATKDRPVFVFIDQLEESEISTYSNMAGAHLYIILLASANFSYFYRRSTNRSSKQLVYRFPFEFNGDTLNKVMAQLHLHKQSVLKSAGALKADSESKFEWPLLPDDLKSVQPFKHSWAKSLSLETPDLEKMFRWTNGHLLPLAEWYLYDSSPANMIKAYITDMQIFIEKDPKGRTFYFLLLKMLKECEQDTNHLCLVSDIENIDYRYVNEKGEVISPFFLQAFEEYLALCRPPSSVLNVNFLADLHNPFESGWVLERECLTNEHLLESASECLALFPELIEFVPPGSRIQRMPYRSLEDINTELKVKAAPFYVHFMPVKVTQRDIDCVQIYSKGDKMVIIGHQVTRQTAQSHDKSLKWYKSTKEFAKLSAFVGKELNFLLLFSCGQDPSTEILEEKEFFDEFVESKVNVADYPAARTFAQRDIARVFHLDADVTLTGRKLTVMLKEKPKATKCGCTAKACTKACSCAKQDFYCGDDCACKPPESGGLCSNRAPPEAVSKKAKLGD